jgi:hypothetical protein
MSDSIRAVAPPGDQRFTLREPPHPDGEPIPIDDQRFTLSVHDLLSAFWHWVEFGPPRGWIPVSERLPGDEWLQAAVYRASDGEIDFAHWDSTEGRFDSYIGNIGSDVTHWMPLPDPPRASDRYPKGQDPQGLGGVAIERGPKDAPKTFQNRSEDAPPSEPTA